MQPLGSSSVGDESHSSAGDSSFVYHDHDSGAHDTNISAAPGDSTDSVTVHLRLRPLPQSQPSAWVANPYARSVSLEPSLGASRSSGGGTHTFDAVHTGSSNDALYRTLARPLVRSVLAGFNALIFAYGQTASGKTFTLSGDEKSRAEGITQKAVKDLFKGIRSSNRQREWLVRCSWVEVYNEGVNDLLDPSNAPQIRASTAKGTFVAPLAEIIVTSPAAIFDLLQRGQQNRHVNATDWNERSSRSHTAFRIVVESWARGEASSSRKKVRVSELVLVDLAGSEKYVTQGGKERRAEGANINKSLLTLGKVIFALSEKNSSSAGASPHIPYRDSKLTRILQNSLGGNSKIAVVATLNQTLGAVDESLSTINFAKRIKKVQLSARLNEIDAPESSGEAQALLVKYRSEADALRRLVQELQQREAGAATTMTEPQAKSSLASAAAGAGQLDTSGIAATATAADAVMEDRIEELEHRLREIGQLVVRGEGSGDGDDGGDVSGEEDMDSWEHSDGGADAGDQRLLTATPTPTTPRTPRSTPRSAAQAHSPTTPSHLNFSMPSSVLRQELHTAHLRITSLQSKLSSRKSAGTDAIPSRGDEKDAMIVSLRKQLAEAEIALEASALQPLPKIREDVEAQYTPRIAELEKDLREARALNEEVLRECERLERVNRRLIQLAHRETSDLVGKLKQERGVSPRKGGGGEGGGVGAGGDATPTMRRLKGAGLGPRPMSVLGDFASGGNANASGGAGGFLRHQRSHFEMGKTSGSGRGTPTPTSAAAGVRRSARINGGRDGDGEDSMATPPPPRAPATGRRPARQRRSSSYDLSGLLHAQRQRQTQQRNSSDAENQGGAMGSSSSGHDDADADESALVVF